MIVCVGLSPAVQRTLMFERLAFGEVNRAQRTWVTASGKAVNVARVLRYLGASPHLVQVIGGESGRFHTAALDADDVTHTSLPDPHDTPTRTCMTLLVRDAAATELVEEAPPLRPEDGAEVARTIHRLLPHARALCLSGSLPTGIGPSFYTELVHAARALGLVTVLDAQREALIACLAERPFLVKPNLDEACAALGRDRTGDDEADAGDAALRLREAGAEWALVTLGRDGSVLAGPDGLRRIASPEISAVVNAIGSGDSLAAGFLHALIDRGAPPPEAAAFGTACAAANCLTPTSGDILLRDVQALLPGVIVSPPITT